MIRLRAAPTAIRTAPHRATLPAPPQRAPAERHQRLIGNEAMGLLARSATIDAALGGPSQPLPTLLRAEMEARFGEDFGAVRLHRDETAAASAEAIGATAYTVGTDVIFAAGAFAPDSVRGRALLAHELAHVVQQGRGGAPPGGDARLSLEQDAVRAAEAPAGGPVAVAGAGGVGVQRQGEPSSAFERRLKRSISIALAGEFGQSAAKQGGESGEGFSASYRLAYPVFPEGSLALDLSGTGQLTGYQWRTPLTSPARSETAAADALRKCLRRGGPRFALRKPLFRSGGACRRVALVHSGDRNHYLSVPGSRGVSQIRNSYSVLDVSLGIRPGPVPGRQFAAQRQLLE
jgi:hypothetical protein